jgi:drug/metabolite transporter (DMT)-like permease
MFVVAYITMFVAVRTAGPVHTSMLMNIEPVVAIGGAVVLLNEVLTVPQVVGVSIVVIAITVMQASAARPVPSARNP